MKMRKQVTGFVAFVAAVAVMVPSLAYAATNPSFTQLISNGSLTMDIVDGSGASVTNPSVAFADKSFSFDCQASTATLGTATQKIAIKNPKIGTVNLPLQRTPCLAC